MDMLGLTSHFLQGLGIAAIVVVFYHVALRPQTTSTFRNIILALLFSVGSVGPMLIAPDFSRSLPFGIENTFVILAMAYGGWWAAIASTLAAAAGRVFLGDPSGILGVVLCSLIGFAFARAMKGRSITMGPLAVVSTLSAVALTVFLAFPHPGSLQLLALAAVGLVASTLVIGRLLRLQKGRKPAPNDGKVDAATDPRTGLLNRRVFDKLGPELADAMNWAGQPYSMAIIDIDAFDDILDRHGEAVGEEALRHVASVVQANVRQTDMVASFGAQAIALVLPAYDAERAFGLAERIRDAVAGAPFLIEGTPVSLTISVGLHTPLPRQEGFWAALGQADTALNRARSTGRNRLEVAN
ncbi:diguanylate cyclase [Nitratireductor sp. ZSWI3]|uniref:GGDEF domain-containing protein n=1 Tax=Nitratireductor sp. ZSWI3 TaxID=2966359 RepID=UPI00214FF4E0|nr:diguanylate cyclase [Nitratireductor sp. ZSWI3]MCR4265252.1 diguanylate cyclase [Nitratireductor sp. ZSWI3]